MSQWQLVSRITGGEEDNKQLSSSLTSFLTKLFICMGLETGTAVLERRKQIKEEMLRFTILRSCPQVKKVKMFQQQVKRRKIKFILP